MAILNLFAPRETRGSTRTVVGNYIDLSTELVTVFDLREDASGQLATSIRKQLQDAVELSPGAILATGTEFAPPVRVHVIRDGTLRRDETGNKFGEIRLAFDKIRFDNIGNGKAVDHSSVTFERDVKLADRGLGVGSVFVLKFKDKRQPDRPRYFKFLVHRFIDRGGRHYNKAFEQTVTALQFEELVPGRVIVPLGIDTDDTGFYIATSKDIPAHFLNEHATSLMWSLRPRKNEFLADYVYDRSFPIAKVVFRKEWQADGHPDSNRVFQPHPPPWVAWTRQRNLMSRSYMNSTYSVGVNNGERDSKDDPYTVLRNDPYTGRTDVNTHRYLYTLFMVDGQAMEFDEYDPPVDVEDQM